MPLTRRASSMRVDLSPSGRGDTASVNDAFDGNGGGFAAADAQRRDAAFQIVRFQRVQQRHDQPRAGGADRMAERAGAAIDIEFFTGDAEVALRSHCDYRKRL